MMSSLAARAAGLALALAGARPAALLGQESIDLLLDNGKVFTADAMLSIHSAVAIRGGQIVAVGGPELRRRYRPARTVDLRGRLVTPGFNDTHIHVRGAPRRHIDLSHFTSIDEIKEAVRRK